MECPVRARESASVLMDYCARKLDTAAAAALERHFQHCEDCQVWIDSQQAVWTALDAWEAAPVSAEFNRGLYQRIARDERPPWWKPLAFRPAVSLALASVVLLAALLIRPARPVDPQVETLDADRLERTLNDIEMLRQLGSM